VKIPLFIKKLAPKFAFVRKRYVDAIHNGLVWEMQISRSREDVPPELVLQFDADKNTDEFLSVYEQPEPLVSICVTTYNRAELLVNRALHSLINQTYKNIEIIVIGDQCTDNTEELVGKCGDPRIRFINLEERGVYPPEGKNRWMVAGTKPINKALELAQGDFICHCDDDDEFDLTKVEKLVKFMLAEKPHFIWHPINQEMLSGEWELNVCDTLIMGSVCTSSMFYHRWFKRVLWDVEAWRFKEPGDWNRVRRMKYIGMTKLRYPEPLIRHHKERTQHSV